MAFDFAHEGLTDKEKVAGTKDLHWTKVVLFVVVLVNAALTGVLIVLVNNQRADYSRLQEEVHLVKLSMESFERHHHEEGSCCSLYKAVAVLRGAEGVTAPGPALLVTQKGPRT